MTDKYYFDASMVFLHLSTMERANEQLYAQATEADRMAYHQGVVRGIRLMREVLDEHMRIEREVDKALAPQKTQIYGMDPVPMFDKPCNKI